MVKRTVKKIISLPVTISSKAAVSSLEDGEYITEDTPYQCQFASSDLAKDILENNIDAKDDPRWKDFGFISKDEYAYWSKRGCGVCCIKMALDYYGIDRSVAKLVTEGVELGGYNTEQDLGWYYKPLILLANKYGVNGVVKSYLSKNELAKCVLEKKFVIASVSPTIIRMDQDNKSKQKSGHLVLVLGFAIKSGHITGFYIHNPSGKTPQMQKNAFIPLDVFTKAYGERGIALSRPTPAL